jgi:hypothetical protein
MARSSIPGDLLRFSTIAGRFEGRLSGAGKLNDVRLLRRAKRNSVALDTFLKTCSLVPQKMARVQVITTRPGRRG